MFEAGQIFTTSKGDDLTMPTIDDTSAKATIVAEYQQSTKRAPSFGSVLLKAHTYRTPIIPVSLELLQDSAFDLDSLLSGLLAESFGRGINEHLTTGSGSSQPKGIVWPPRSVQQKPPQPPSRSTTLSTLFGRWMRHMRKRGNSCSTAIRCGSSQKSRITTATTSGRKEPGGNTGHAVRQELHPER